MTVLPKPPTATLLARIKRTAKRCEREQGVPHSTTLEREARIAGYSSWHALQQAANASVPAAVSLPIDPPLRPGFDNTPNEERTREELEEWWERPFLLSLPGGGFEVRCLDGGAWDRSTYYGRVKTVEEGAALASRKLARWRHGMQRPLVFVDDDDRVLAVRASSALNGGGLEILFGPATHDEVKAFVRDWEIANPPPE